VKESTNIIKSIVEKLNIEDYPLIIKRSFQKSFDIVTVKAGWKIVGIIVEDYSTSQIQATAAEIARQDKENGRTLKEAKIRGCYLTSRTIQNNIQVVQMEKEQKKRRKSASPIQQQQQQQQQNIQQQQQQQIVPQHPQQQLARQKQTQQQIQMQDQTQQIIQLYLQQQEQNLMQDWTRNFPLEFQKSIKIYKLFP
jgi:hypothetical protein